MHNPGSELLASDIVVFIILYREKNTYKTYAYITRTQISCSINLFYFLIYFSLNDVHGICLIQKNAVHNLTMWKSAYMVVMLVRQIREIII